MLILIISSYSKSLINFRGELIKSFIDKGYKVVVMAPDQDSNMLHAFKRMGVEFKFYDLERTGTNFFYDVKSFFSLKKSIKEINPHLVLSYTIKPVIYGSLASKINRVNKIYSMITGLGSSFENKISLKTKILSVITRLMYRISLSNIDGVIFQNPDDLKVFLSKKLVKTENSFRVFGSGVDLDHFYPAKAVIRPVRFLFIGRLIKDKGIKEFIEAAKIISKKNPNIEFDIVGWADDNPSGLSPQEIEEWEIYNFIKFHGKVEDVRPYIKNSSVFVLPSYREGTPRTALEAMAMARPLIITDAPGCRETVRDGVNGYLVPVQNCAKIAEAMEKFINTPRLIEQMGKESRRFAEEVYDVHKVNKEIHKILEL